MNWKEFSKTMEQFDAIVAKCKICNHDPGCEMHRIVKYIDEKGKTQFLAELKEKGLERIIKNLNAER